MREIILISSVIISSVLFFLVFKTMRNETHFKNEITKLNRQINDLNSSLLIKEKNVKNLDNSVEPDNKAPNIQDEYHNYLETNFNTNADGSKVECSDELSDDLKSKINDLSQDGNDLSQDGNDINSIDNNYNIQNINSSNIEEEYTNHLSSNIEELDSSNLDGIESSNTDNLEEFETNNLEGVEFETNNLEGVELESNNLEGVELESNTLEGVELESNTLEGVELESNTLEGVELESNNLEGVELESLSTDNIISQQDNTSNEMNQEMIQPYKKYSLEELEKMTIKELQDVARANRLKIKGKKNELVERVKAFYNFNNNLN